MLHHHLVSIQHHCHLVLTRRHCPVSIQNCHILSIQHRHHLLSTQHHHHSLSTQHHHHLLSTQHHHHSLSTQHHPRHSSHTPRTRNRPTRPPSPRRTRAPLGIAPSHTARGTSRSIAHIAPSAAAPPRRNNTTARASCGCSCCPHAEASLHTTNTRASAPALRPLREDPDVETADYHNHTRTVASTPTPPRRVHVPDGSDTHIAHIDLPPHTRSPRDCATTPDAPAAPDDPAGRDTCDRQTLAGRRRHVPPSCSACILRALLATSTPPPAARAPDPQSLRRPSHLRLPTETGRREPPERATTRPCRWRRERRRRGRRRREET